MLLTERDIPTPQSISPQAQAILEATALRDRPAMPQTLEAQPWRDAVAKADAEWLTYLAASDALPGVTDRMETIGGVKVYVLEPDQPLSDGVYLDIHGGGFVMLGGEACRLMAKLTAVRLGVRVYSVDYRMPPDHPYPAALDDSMTVYRELLGRYGADKVVVGGASAGGNIAAALALKARETGVPMPAGLVLLTPALDLTESGDTFATNRDVDVVLRGPIPWMVRLYAGEADLADPLLSPLFADFTKGFPPTFLQSGTRDLFLSNVVRMHRALRKAAVPCELHVFEAMPHGGFGGAPEDMELGLEMRRFVAERLGAVG